MVFTAIPIAIASAAPDLIVEIRGIGSTHGQIRCALYDDASRWLSRDVRASDAVRPEGDSARCRFPALPEGIYAVSVLHDEDDDGEMDLFLGLPRERWGVSRDAPARFGRPRFEDAAFLHDGRTIVIHLR